MSVYFIGDPHFGHKNLPRFRKFISSSEENEKLICDEWKAKLNKRSIIYVMGDAAFTTEALDLYSWLPGKKILIKGNHDDMVSTMAQLNVFDEVHGMLKYKGFWITHCPISKYELRGKINLHGHTHNATIMKRTWYGKKIEDPDYFNLCPDVIYPKFGKCILSLEEVRSYCYGRRK